MVSNGLVTPAYVRTMAAYNAEMNRRLYAASERIPDAKRREPRGAFWGSLHGTLCHLLWGDRMWMSRFDAWPKPTVVQKDSATLVSDFDELHRLRVEADDKIGAGRERMGIGMRQPVAARDVECGGQPSRRVGTPRLECLEIRQVRQRVHDPQLVLGKAAAESCPIYSARHPPGRPPYG